MTKSLKDFFMHIERKPEPVLVANIIVPRKKSAVCGGFFYCKYVEKC